MNFDYIFDATVIVINLGFLSLQSNSYIKKNFSVKDINIDVKLNIIIVNIKLNHKFVYIICDQHFNSIRSDYFQA